MVLGQLMIVAFDALEDGRLGSERQRVIIQQQLLIAILDVFFGALEDYCLGFAICPPIMRRPEPLQQHPVDLQTVGCGSVGPRPEKLDRHL